jgi:hypothetical protein
MDDELVKGSRRQYYDEMSDLFNSHYAFLQKDNNGYESLYSLSKHLWLQADKIGIKVDKKVQKIFKQSLIVDVRSCKQFQKFKYYGVVELKADKREPCPITKFVINHYVNQWKRYKNNNDNAKPSLNIAFRAYKKKKDKEDPNNSLTIHSIKKTYNRNKTFGKDDLIDYYLQWGPP